MQPAIAAVPFPLLANFASGSVVEIWVWFERCSPRTVTVGAWVLILRLIQQSNPLRILLRFQEDLNWQKALVQDIRLHERAIKVV